jgi:hypothetical protein
MNTSLRHLLLCAPGLLLALGARAQVEHRIVIRADADAQATAMAAVDAQQIAADAQMAARDAMGQQGDMAFIHTELAQARVVKGAPYCADAVHESIQPLADGNRIVHSQSTRQCRDGEGRTRQEVERDGRRMVYLNDPVQKESWVLDPDKKTARKLGSAMASVEGAVWQQYAQQMREWAQKVKEQVHGSAGADALPPVPAAHPPIPPQPPAPVLLSQSDKTIKDEQGREQHEVRVEVLRVDVDDAPNMAPLPRLLPPAAVTAHAMIFAPRGPGVQSSLGGKELEGLKVTGERTTWTIEAGKVGNDKPIVITRDVWTSPDLRLTVASRDFDPRSGESNYRLQNLRRGEPDAALMKVPADYAQTLPRRAPKAASAPARG